jgi:hypothetical protein
MVHGCNAKASEDPAASIFKVEVNQSVCMKTEEAGSSKTNRPLNIGKKFITFLS